VTIGRRDLFRFPLRGVLPEPDQRPRRPPIGADPGQIPVVPAGPPVRVTVTAYGPHEITELHVGQLELLRTMRGRWPVMWVNAESLPREMILRDLGEIFDLPRLALEDLGDFNHPAKVEAYGDELLFIIAHVARLNPGLELERVAVFLGPDYVLTFQERPGDVLEPVRERVRASRGQLRTSGPDYLAYAVVDVVMDHWFPVTEAYTSRLDGLEAEVRRRPTGETMERLYQAKGELLALRTALAPLNDALADPAGDPGPLVKPETLIHLRDTRDHGLQLLALVDTCGERAAALTDVHLASTRERSNDLVRMVILIATGFLVLGVVTSVYAMAAEPAGTFWWRLPYLLGLMGVAGLGLALWWGSRSWRRSG